MAVAAAAAADLRRSNPKQYPPAPHTWNRVAGRQLVRPLLCAVCFKRIQPDGDGKVVSACYKLICARLLASYLDRTADSAVCATFPFVTLRCVCHAGCQGRACGHACRLTDHAGPDAQLALRAQTVNACAVCGEVSHEGCARHVPHDCRPIAMDADEMTHLWRPAGVSMSMQDVGLPVSCAVDRTGLCACSDHREQACHACSV